MILQDCSCETVANSVSRRTDVLSRGIRSTRDYTVAGGTCDQVLAVRDGSRYCHTGELVGCRYNAGRRARGEPWRTAFAPRNSCNSKYIRRANRTRAGRSSPMCDTHTPSIISWFASLVRLAILTASQILCSPRRNRSPNKKSNRTACRARVIVAGRACCQPADTNRSRMSANVWHSRDDESGML